ncbi:hypothetical protein NV379_01745 [Paenibacillus sp. N1-5-1-14]|uniref:hypothetical protein n=1 Tax=Paenibacillus radicibacter TaxID=2972488 RepID=UPI0021590E24|nr:hypothetical protein [Paenibacillus radicibacter]MCR8641368.1 hypothetical protein [Paenibacillus radicibacter]
MDTSKLLDDNNSKSKSNAWKSMKEKLPSGLPAHFVDLLESTYLTGYVAGVFDGEKQLKYLAKIDPTQYYKWLNEG